MLPCMSKFFDVERPEVAPFLRRVPCPARPPLPRNRPPPRSGIVPPTLKALADPIRLEIVSRVAAAKESLCACEIEAHFDLSQSTISDHLGLLRKAGILDAELRTTA